MRKLMKKWLFYGLGKTEYKKTMEKIFSKNIRNLRQINLIAAVLVAGYIVIVLWVKSPSEYLIDAPNVLFAGIIDIVIVWNIIINRLTLASMVNLMETERNNFYKQSTVDELTQLKNRRDFSDTFQRYLSCHRQADNFLCIAVLDIDFFRNFNDHYGNAQGDECLRKIGAALKELYNSVNVYAARIGGEEFALLWFEEQAADAKYTASLINETVRDLNIPHEKSSAAPYVTVSVGLYVLRCGSPETINHLYDKADKALYAAKKNGRNMAVIHYSDDQNFLLLKETA